MKPPANGLIDGFNDGLTSGMDRPCTQKKGAYLPASLSQSRLLPTGKVASVTPSVNVNIERGDGDDDDARFQGVRIYLLASPTQSTHSHTILLVHPTTPLAFWEKYFVGIYFYLIGTQSGGYPWIDVGRRRPGTLIQRHDPAAAGGQLRVLLMLVAMMFLFSFLVQSQPVVDVDRLLVGDVVDITRTLADGAVFPINKQKKRNHHTNF